MKNYLTLYIYYTVVTVKLNCYFVESFMYYSLFFLFWIFIKVKDVQ